MMVHDDRPAAGVRWLGALIVAAGAAVAAGQPEPGRPYAIIDGERVAVPDIKMGDPAVVEAIIREGRDRSRVMDTLAVLVEDYGPRLTGSTRQEEAAKWARNQFSSWGLSGSRLWEWGTIETRFDRGPSTARVFLSAEEERGTALNGFSTLSWVRGTDGAVRGPAVPFPADDAEFAANRSRYGGAWVMLPPEYEGRAGVRGTGFLMRQRNDEYKLIRSGGDVSPTGVNRPLGEKAWGYPGRFCWGGGAVAGARDLNPPANAVGGGIMEIPGNATGEIAEVSFDRRSGELSFDWANGREVTEVSLTVTEEAAEGRGENTRRGGGGEVKLKRVPRSETPEKDRPSLLKRVLELDPAGFVSSSKDERVWTTSAGNWREMPLSEYGRDVEVNISAPDYDFARARLAEGATVEFEFDLNHTLTAGPIAVHNVIAEIRGTEWPDEVVIMSAHLDSWDGPGSKGTVDNGTGSAVTMEAARILSAVGARPKRTIRFILWTGEEQGLLGSRAYVESLSEEERAKISAVFVDDGGTNYQGGTAALRSMVPYLAAATAPVNGRFISEEDRIAQLRDSNPDNDITAGMLDVNITSLDRERLPPGGGSDHASFNAVGIPGFYWNETGRANYQYAWHTQHDSFERAIPEYLAQSATNTAVALYNLACAPELLPRTNEVAQAAGER